MRKNPDAPDLFLAIPIIGCIKDTGNLSSGNKEVICFLREPASSSHVRTNTGIFSKTIRIHFLAYYFYMIFLYDNHERGLKENIEE
jgi:hypothetical protein